MKKFFHWPHQAPTTLAAPNYLMVASCLLTGGHRWGNWHFVATYVADGEQRPLEHVCQHCGTVGRRALPETFGDPTHDAPDP